MQNVCQLFSKSTIAIIRIRAGLTCPPWLSTHFNRVGSEVQHELEGCWICSKLKKCSRKKHGEGTDARYTENRHKTWEQSEKFKKPVVSENPLKKLHGQSLWLGELSSFGFWGLMLIHTRIQTWFHRFAQPGSSLAKNLAGGLQHGCQLSFSTEICPTILQHNFLLFVGQGNMSCHGYVLQTGRVSRETGKCVFLWPCVGFVHCRIEEWWGFPRHSLQCNQLHHIMNLSSPQSPKALSPSSKCFFSISPWFVGRKMSLFCRAGFQLDTVTTMG